MERKRLFISLAVIVALCMVTSFTMAWMPRSFAFSLARVEGQKVIFQGEQGCVWTEVSYMCSGCPFFVSETSVRGLVDQIETGGEVGVVAQLHEGGTALSLTCNSMACEISVTPTSGLSETRRLLKGELTVVPTNAKVLINILN